MISKSKNAERKYIILKDVVILKVFPIRISEHIRAALKIEAGKLISAAYIQIRNVVIIFFFLNSMKNNAHQRKIVKT